jgi:hypothetical protein
VKQASVRQFAATGERRGREVCDGGTSVVGCAAVEGGERHILLPEDQREWVWTLYLRGLSKRQIAAQVGFHRDTVARLVNACLRECGAERRARLTRKLDGAVARLRAVQAQAWEDHDADGAEQRGAYLRVALDAEKEIARLEGLYAVHVRESAAVVFRIERVERVERGVGS